MNRFLITIIVLVCSLSVSRGEQWLPETSLVDGTGTSGFYNSIAVTPDGTPHVAYFSDGSDDLRYAVLSNDTWHAETVDASGDRGRHCSIAVDSSGVPHISYYYTYQQTVPIIGTVTRGELKYVAGAAGTPVTLDNSPGDVGQYTAIGLTSNDLPRVAYHNATYGDLWYRAKTGASWGTAEEVESGGKAASIAIDSSGRTHIAYVFESNLKYTYWTGSAWSTTTIRAGDVLAERTAIALDASDQAHIVCVDDSGIQYSAWNGSGWSYETVHFIPGMGASAGVASPSIVLDSAGRPCISYYGDFTGDGEAVVVVVRTGVDEWTPTWVAEGLTPGGQTSLAIDTNGIMHVSYFNSGAGSLWYGKVAPDSDEDWLPDWWEMKYYNDLDEDGFSDTDGDGAICYTEYENGTDPTVDDGSGGGEWDRDGDGLSNDDETGTHGTDPDDPDSDDDGLLDGVEVGYHLLWDSFEEPAIEDGWTNGGDQVWTIDSSTSQNESQSARSGVISDGQSSTLELEAVLLGEGSMSFWYRTSCETNSDHLRFSTNGTTYATYSGSNDWTLAYIDGIPAGTNTFRWTYEKDSSGSAGDDAVWIDAVYVGVTAIGSSPTNSDSDADGLLDGEEVNTYGTSPTLADTDNDGLSDSNEVHNLPTDPTLYDTDGDLLSDGEEVNTYSTNPIDADSDDDGLTDEEEVKMYLTDPWDTDTDDDGIEDRDEIYTTFTDPKDSDSDDDGLSDGDEVNTYGTLPKDSDTDNDGLSDGAEVNTYTTDPKDDDSDDDGLLDGAEVNTHSTDPKDSDSDNDDMPDGWEVDNTLNPTNGTDAVTDIEPDGLSNLEEYQNGTDPRDADSDHDLMPDRWEVDNTLNPTNGTDAVTDIEPDGLSNLEEYQNGTDPRDADSDHDLMPDGWEVDNTLNPTNGTDAVTDIEPDGLSNLEEYQNGTDPHDADSDNDLMPDGWEVTQTFNPTNASDATPDIEPDGLSNLEEYQNGTDPRDADSDNDLMPDGWEVDNTLNPTNGTDAATDIEPDGLNNLEEYQNGTDPRDSDCDNDSMPDGWEVDNTLNPTNGTDAATDIEPDGLSNLEEYQNGTDPRDADSDHDLMPDGWEVDNTLNPTNGTDAATDIEPDGLSNLEEYQNGTDPRDADSDHDLMPDGWEVDNTLNPTNGTDAATDIEPDGLNNLEEYQNGTDPRDADSDNDLMPDGWEVDNTLNPTNATDAATDIELDGLSNLEEYQNGTDPRDADSDNDLMPDGWEVEYSLNPTNSDALLDPDTDGLNNLGEYQNGTDPHVWDTDQDGLSDGDEVSVHQTDPRKSDSDGDGIPDGWEVQHNLQPTVDDAGMDGDADGLDNLNEYQAGSNPWDADSDQDTMPDKWEVDNGLQPMEDDSSADPDGDNLTNLQEYQLGTNPQVADNNDPAYPSTYYVATNSLSDGPGTAWSNAFHTIQAAVNASSSGDTVVVGSGAYVLTNEVTVAKGIRLTSLAGCESTIIDGNFPVTTNRCVYVNHPDAMLDGFTITRGRDNGSGGGVYCYQAQLIRNCVIVSNSADSGAGIVIYEDSTLQNCDIRYNMGGDCGGVAAFNGRILDCRIDSNTASDSLGVGGVMCVNAVVSNSTISGNSGLYYGGLWFSGGTIKDSTICGNDGFYGSVYGQSPGGLLTDCSIVSNTAEYGGGIYLDTGGTVVNCTIANNSADRHGGGVYIKTSGVVDHCIITNNVCSDDGGGIYISGTSVGERKVSGSKITDNRASSWGGGAYLYADGLLRNCQITDNRATDAGGVYIAGYAALESCTVSANAATNSTSLAGGIRCGGGGMVSNSIVYHNTSVLGNGNYYHSSSVNSNFYYSCTTPAFLGEGNIDQLPRFVGWTVGDYRLTAFSPCVDAGTNQAWMTSAHDLDGLPRIVNGRPDMGAYEYLPLVVDLGITKDVDNIAPRQADVITYTLSVTNAGTVEATGVQATDVLPAGVTYQSNDGGGRYNWLTGVWNIETLPAQTSTVLHIVAKVDIGTAGNMMTNIATVAWGGTDIELSNNTAEIALRVQDPGVFRFQSSRVVRDERRREAAVTVLRERGADGDATVNFATKDQTAIQIADYIPTNGVLVFTNSQTMGIVTVEICDDALLEGHEYLNLKLSGPSNYAEMGSPAETALIIQDDEAVRVFGWWDFSRILPVASRSGLPVALDEASDNWTVVTNGTAGAAWRFDDPGSRGNLTGGSNGFALADGAFFGVDGMDTELRTPCLALTNMRSVTLSFKTDFLAGSGSTADVDVSTNGVIGPWSNVWRKSSIDYRGAATEDVNISDLASGQSNVMIRFHYVASSVSGWWQVDEIEIRGEADDDHDGMPDWWETFYGLTPDAPPGFDSDQDGLTDLDEYRVDTDPSRSTNRLAIIDVRVTDGAILKFLSSPFVKYGLDRKDTLLLPEAWSNIVNDVYGVGGTQTFQDPGVSRMHYYRIRGRR